MDRVSTGIEGFDEMTGGGFPEDSINFLTGSAGSGKTLFAMQFAVEGGRRGDETVYLTVNDMAESDTLIRAAEGYDVPLGEAVEKNLVRLHDYDSLKDRTGQGLVDFDDLTGSIDTLLAPTDADRLIIDSVAGLGISDNSRNDTRRSILRFIRRLRENDMTALLITEKDGEGLTRYGVEEHVGDSLVVLGFEQMENRMDRSVHIRKMRFTDHDTSFRPMEITDDGMVVHSQGQVF
jgi:KaiC/GvpD/RAD55 family RecA-like ATPase